MVRRKRRKNRVKISFILLLFIVLGGIGYLLYNKYYNVDKELDNSNNSTINNNEVVDKEEPLEEYEATLIAVGDNLIHSSIYKQANQNANYKGYDFKPMLTYIKDIVTNYDIGYYNQETILGGTDLGLSDYPTFNSPYEAGNDMIDAGFNLVSLATNHTVDKGQKAVVNSCAYWKEKQGILTAGSYCSFDERNEIKIDEKNNITYTMLNYTYGTNGMPVSEDYLAY